jgi:hypothetical protein
VNCISEKPNKKSQLTKYWTKIEERRKMRNHSEISKDSVNWGRDCEHKGRSGRNNWTAG